MRSGALAMAALALTACSDQPRPQAEKKSTPDPVHILQFYASHSIARAGENVLVCYGVENAASVSIDPPVEELSPSFNRCIAVPAKQTTKYTLRATGKDGSVATKEISVIVEKGAKTPVQKGTGELISFFVGSTQQSAPGQPVTLCYQVRGVSSLSLTPDPGARLSTPKGCVMVK